MNLTLRLFYIMNTGNTLLAFIAGAAVGAVAALLMAPESGEKTRERIMNKAEGAAGAVKAKLLEELDAVETALEKK